MINLIIIPTLLWYLATWVGKSVPACSNGLSGMAYGVGGGLCGGCKWEEYRIVSVVYGDNAKALNIFREHGVLHPRSY